MKFGLVLLLIYVAYNVAAYGAPELKVMGFVAAFLLACFGSFEGTKNKQDKNKVSGVDADK